MLWALLLLSIIDFEQLIRDMNAEHVSPTQRLVRVRCWTEPGVGDTRCVVDTSGRSADRVSVSGLSQ